MKDQLEPVKKKARMLQRAFPANLTLAQAQEATAKLLGFKDWHWLAHSAGEGKPLLPPLMEATSEHLPASIFKVVQLLHDEYHVPPGLARNFYFGWGVFTKPVTSPFEYEFFYWNRVLKGEEREGPSADGEDEGLFDDEGDGPVEIIPGVIEASGGKYRYWFLSPERLNQVPWPLRGQREGFLSFEDAAAVAVTFADEFPEDKVREARNYLRHEPTIYEWLFPEASRSDGEISWRVSVAGVRAQALATPNAWLPLSYRWRALPYRSNPVGEPEMVFSAMQGRNLVDLIDSRGRFRLSDVKWFDPRGKLPFERLDGLIVPLDVDRMVECPPQYGYPFKHGPFSQIEYSAHQEGGDPGLGFVPEQY